MEFQMIASISSTKVLVTGANGFIGLHTTLRLLQLGYDVRATVRSEVHKKNVIETLSKHLDASNLEFALADLLRDEGWNEAVQGCRYVIHTASPYRAENPKNEDEMIIPARDGTLRVLKAAQVEGVERIVMLSSVVAISSGHEGENRTFDENDWSDLVKTHSVYSKSKTLAEHAAWDFFRSAENKSVMEMVAINPTNVFGPVLDGHTHTSTEWYRTIMRAESPGVARMQIDLVDVRDLVEVLIKALTVPEAAGKRFLCNGASIPLKEFADILHDNFSNRGFRVPTRILPDFVIRFMGMFMPKIKAVVEQLQWEHTLSTEQAQLVFGWQPRPYTQTIIEMAESLVKFGLV
jgi:nucleoside-diphosphate-sugar epimerase